VKVKRLVIYTDGASRGNPGPAAIGVVIRDSSGQVVTSISRYIGETTNNQAEYRAIVAALEEAIRLRAREVEINSDSELVVKQIKGQYRVKRPALKPLYRRVKELLGVFDSFSIDVIPREQNREADALANRAF
jgi:ribonuclease HI/probable phosphoglycerate mutase